MSTCLFIISQTEVKYSVLCFFCFPSDLASNSSNGVIQLTAESGIV